MSRAHIARRSSIAPHDPESIDSSLFSRRRRGAPGRAVDACNAERMIGAMRPVAYWCDRDTSYPEPRSRQTTQDVSRPQPIPQDFAEIAPVRIEPPITARRPASRFMAHQYLDSGERIRQATRVVHAWQTLRRLSSASIRWFLTETVEGWLHVKTLLAGQRHTRRYACG